MKMSASEITRLRVELQQLDQHIALPVQIGLDCLTNPEIIVNEARLLAAFLRTSTGAFAFNGSRPSPITKDGQMVWLVSGEHQDLITSGDEQSLTSHWSAARKAMQSCAPVTTVSSADGSAVIGYPIVLSYQGKQYPKAAITAALPPNTSEDPANVARLSMEILTSAISREISAKYSSYAECLNSRVLQSHLLEEKDRLEAVLQAIDVGLCLVDRNLKITWANRTNERWFGLEKQLVGNACCQLFNSKDADECSCPVKAAFIAEEIQSRVRENIATDDGVRDLRLTANPILGPDGSVSEVLLVASDITQRLQAVRQTERYRKLVDNADDYVVMADINGKILMSNKKIRDVLGYTEDELNGRNGRCLHPKEDWPAALALVNEAVENERARGELRLLTKDGREIPTELIITYSKTDKTFQGIFRDISERLSMEKQLQKRTEQLEKQNRRVLTISRKKGQFFANMSHELKTPLTSIIGFTELLIEDEDDPLTEQQRKQLSKVVSSAQKLLQMINELLDLSKIEAGKMEVNLSEVDVRRLIEQCVSSIVPLVRDRNIELAIAVERDLPELYTDEQKLEQILVNLLSNASKFTHKGQIKVEAHNVKGKLHISVSDTGIGIRKSDLNKIFEEFAQADQPGGKKVHGTGLGLTIAKRLAHLLGGDIKVKSRVGEGSTFTIVLPFSLTRSRTTRRSKTSAYDDA